MKKFFLSVLVLAGLAALWLLQAEVLTAFVLWTKFHDEMGGEALITLVTILVGLPTLYAIWLPDYVAVVFHDGEQFFDIETTYSKRKPDELFAKTECQPLFGRYIKNEEVGNLRVPVVDRVKFQWFGRRRGVYNIMQIYVTPQGVSVLDAETLHPRTDQPRVRFEEPKKISLPRM